MWACIRPYFKKRTSRTSNANCLLLQYIVSWFFLTRFSLAIFLLSRNSMDVAGRSVWRNYSAWVKNWTILNVVSFTYDDAESYSGMQLFSSLSRAKLIFSILLHVNNHSISCKKSHCSVLPEREIINIKAQTAQWRVFGFDKLCFVGARKGLIVIFNTALFHCTCGKIFNCSKIQNTVLLQVLIIEKVPYIVIYSKYHVRHNTRKLWTFKNCQDFSTALYVVSVFFTIFYY